MLEDEWLAPRIAVARQVCQPGHRLRPHITVRYPAMGKTEGPAASIYSASNIARLTVVGPGRFGPTPTDSDLTNDPSVVFLHCESLELERLTYKPDFPDSVFHLTLYEGADTRVADSVLNSISNLEWGWDIMLPNSIRLEHLPIGVPKTSTARWRTSDEYIQRAASLLRDQGVTIPFEPNGGSLEKVPTDGRLEFVRELFRSLAAQRGGKGRPAGSSGMAQSRIEQVPFCEVKTTLFDLESYRSVPADDRTYRSALPGLAKSDDGIAEGPTHYATLPELSHEVMSVALASLRIQGTTSNLRVGSLAPYSRQLIATLDHLLSHAGSLRVELLVAHERDIAGMEELRSLTKAYKLYSLRNDRPETDFPDIVGCNLVVSNLVDTLVDRTSSRVSTVEALHLAGVIGSERHNNAHSPQIPTEIESCRWRYVFSVLLGHRWMVPDAIGVWILPSQFLTSPSAMALRNYLSTSVELLFLHNYRRSIPSTSSLRADYAVVVIRNRRPSTHHEVEWSDGPYFSPTDVDDRHDVSHVRVTSGRLRRARKWDYLNLESPDGSRAVIGDLFDVRIASEFGPRSSVVVDREAATRLSEFGVRHHSIFPPIRKLLDNSIDLAQVHDSALACFDDRLIVPPSEIDYALARLRHDQRQVIQLYRLLNRYGLAIPSALSSHFRSDIPHRKSGSVQDAIEIDDRPNPILFTNVRGRRDRFVRPARFVRNLTERKVLSNYLVLRLKPFTAKAVLEGELDLEGLFRSLQGLESDLLARHVRFHRSGSRPFRGTDVRSFPVPEWALPSGWHRRRDFAEVLSGSC